MNFTEKILFKIKKKGRGWVFSPKDFVKIRHYNTINPLLDRLEKRGEIRSLGKGLYDLPIILKGNKDLEVGDYVMFAKANKFYEAPFVKIVGGVAGDIISVRNREYYNGSLFLGKSKLSSISGDILTSSQGGEIKSGEYYVYASHEDSLDSRYEEIGKISDSDVIGKAYPIRLWGGDE